MMRRLTAALGAFLIAACSGAPAPVAGGDEAGAAQGATAEAGARAALTAALPELFDCLRETGGVVVAAHRGGPAPGYPENVLETLQHAYERGIRVFEIDIHESRDGVLFLHHDDRFGRVIEGTGYVSDTDWADVAGRRLIDNDGTATEFRPSKLTDVLLWAKEAGAIIQLDRKRTTGFRNIAEAVKAAGAESIAVFISYNDQEAAEIARYAPGMVLTASVRGARDIERLEALGVDRTRLIAWTGTREPDPPAFARLNAEGVEPAFGTLGRRGERLDDVYWADGDGSEYQQLVDDGVVMISTDEPYRVTDWLSADDEGWAACAVR
ncbi:glycerophosphodiester phosphodiesterase family protein [Hyphomonas sp.]|uniref:glycerophosphodiester phosphodiesterase family protein n=1 Tax=Hyphomonas sp. TaxID=87 RepID=UPI00391BBC7D